MPTATNAEQALLLDTHAAIWLMSGEELTDDARRSIESASSANSLFVSPITAWEIATLVRKGRMALSLEPDAWFDAMLNAGVRLAVMPPRTLIASAFLPGALPGDPADRIIVATARNENLTLVTRDTQLLQYSRSGHVRTLSC
jgi:PIN domain nuclease of toxin-antitoxin system